MVANHKKLHRKLLGYIRFQDITKAVRFVAGGELGKLKKQLKRRFTALGSFLPLFSKRYVSQEFNKCLLVSISDDRGSCGAHNNMIYTATTRLVDFLEEENKGFRIYSIGFKGMNYIKRFHRKYLIGYSFNMYDIRPSIDMCIFFIYKFLKYRVNRYYFLFNRYYTLQIQRPAVYRLCNYETFYNSIYKHNVGRYGIYYNAIIDQFKHPKFSYDLYTFGLSIFFVDALNENKFSFYGGRFTAMDNAVNNSQEIIDRLRILYNKARQEYITTELVEIVACAESITFSEEPVRDDTQYKFVPHIWY